MNAGRHVDLRDLAERIRSIEKRHGAPAEDRCIDPPAREMISTGWAEIDAALGGGLPAGGLHEFFGVEEAGPREAAAPPARGSLPLWTPPLCFLIHLAWQALDRDAACPWVVWIGARCHPYPRALVRGRPPDRRLLERSLFVAPRDAAERLWAIDLALRSAAVAAVVADGGALDRAATQRVQLLAKNRSKVVFAARPPWERTRLSAAQTRWHVRAAPPRIGKKAGGVAPGWSVELLRCKGVRPAQDHRAWLLEQSRDEGLIHLSARLADLAGAPAAREPRAPDRLSRRL
ncbi:MAG: hypothetical protein DCC65_17370, partial [Planctomycetota bacterium]